MTDDRRDILDDQCLGVEEEALGMTILALYEKIAGCLDKLSKVTESDDSAFELELLVTQLRIRLHAGVYEPLKKLHGDAGPELCRFLKLVAQLDSFIGKAETRPQLVKEVASIAKRVLAKEGIPFRA